MGVTGLHRRRTDKLVRKPMYSGKVLGKPDKEGEIPVREIDWTC